MRLTGVYAKFVSDAGEFLGAAPVLMVGGAVAWQGFSRQHDCELCEANGITELLVVAASIGLAPVGYVEHGFLFEPALPVDVALSRLAPGRPGEWQDEGVAWEHRDTCRADQPPGELLTRIEDHLASVAGNCRVARLPNCEVARLVELIHHARGPGGVARGAQ